MPYAIYWIAALAVCVLGLAISLVWALRRPAYANKGLPGEWSLTARPVFTADERRVFRLLREALPHHIVLSKLPLVRFCQPTEAKEVRYWIDLLGASHVTFAVCSPNGRVLAFFRQQPSSAGRAGSVTLHQIDITGRFERQIPTPGDASDPAWSPLIPQ